MKWGKVSAHQRGVERWQCGLGMEVCKEVHGGQVGRRVVSQRLGKREAPKQKAWGFSLSLLTRFDMVLAKAVINVL
jgi:hypothetical protein